MKFMNYKFIIYLIYLWVVNSNIIDIVSLTISLSEIGVKLEVDEIYFDEFNVIYSIEKIFAIESTFIILRKIWRSDYSFFIWKQYLEFPFVNEKLWDSK